MKDLKQIGESLEELQQQYPQQKGLLVISEKVCSPNCSNILIGNSRNLNALETDLVLFILKCKENPVNLLLDRADHSVI